MLKPLAREDAEVLLTNSLYDTDDRRTLAKWAILNAPFDALMHACLHYGAHLQSSGSLTPYAYITCADVRQKGDGVPTLAILARRCFERDLVCNVLPRQVQRPTLLEFRTRGAVHLLTLRYDGRPFLEHPTLGREDAWLAWLGCIQAAKRGTQAAQRRDAIEYLREAQAAEPSLSLPEFALAYARHRLNELDGAAHGDGLEL